jgi:hypothetical protein
MPTLFFKKGHIAWNKGTKGIMKAWNKGKKCPELGVKGRIPWNKGKKCPTISNSLRGLIPWNKGIKHSEETIIKIKRIAKERGFGFGNRGNKRPDLAYYNKTHIKYGSNHPLWKGGTKHYAPHFNKQLKDRARVRDNFICQICGIPELECNERLNIHHIDYNKNNHDIKNLVSLCHSCHAKTNYDRNKWIKFFSKEVKIDK